MRIRAAFASTAIVFAAIACSTFAEDDIEPLPGRDAGSDALDDASALGSDAGPEAAPPPKNVKCGSASCRADLGQVCCFDPRDGGPQGCSPRGQCTAPHIESSCDDVKDCADKPSTICCATCRNCVFQNPQTCVVLTGCTGQYDKIACDPTDPNACAGLQRSRCVATASALLEGTCE